MICQIFASYMMQCLLVLILWFGLTGSEFLTTHRKNRSAKATHIAHETRKKTAPKSTSEDKETHHDNFETLLTHFHQVQCYFSGVLQIVALSVGIFDIDMLSVFMFLPLATNGILPIAFTYVMLLRSRKATTNATLLTTSYWLLASLVYWVLYSNILPFNTQTRNEDQAYRDYQQYLYQLSALDACGGSSALAVCPDTFTIGRAEIFSSSHKLRVLTPIIWTFSTFILLVALCEKYKTGFWNRRHEKIVHNSRAEIHDYKGEERTGPPIHAHLSQRSLFDHPVFYGLVSFCFLVGMAMQLSMLTICLELNMMDKKDWSFRQVLVITIWAPPLLDYVCREVRILLRAGKGVV